MGSMEESRIRAAREVARMLESENPTELSRVLEILEPLMGCEISWYDGYASRREGPADAVVLAANWNAQKVRVGAPVYWRGESERAMPRIAEALERITGLALEWCDEGSGCDACGRWIRTEADGFDYKPEYRLDDSGFTCLACLACCADEADEA